MARVDMKSEGMIEVLTSVNVERDAPRTVLFDFDGVLFRGDAFYLFIRHRFAHSWVCKLLAVVTLPWWLICMLVSWRRGAHALVRIALYGLNQNRYKTVVETFADELARRPQQFYRDGLYRLRRHQAAGDKVIVVTGCEQILVTRLLSQLGLSELTIVASQLKPAMFGMRVQIHNIGSRKVENLANLGITRWQRAYSDSLIDLPMLKPAVEAVLVNGTPKLCKRLEKALSRSIRWVAWN